MGFATIGVAWRALAVKLRTGAFKEYSSSTFFIRQQHSMEAAIEQREARDVKALRKGFVECKIMSPARTGTSLIVIVLLAVFL